MLMPYGRRAPARCTAFTLVELTGVIVILAILVALLIPQLRGPRVRASKIGCLNCLKQVGLAFRIYGTDNGDRFPMEVLTNESRLPLVAARPAFFYGLMSNELTTPYVVACPTDTRRPATNWQSLSPTNVSYFVGLQAAERWPQALLAGDRNLTTNGVPAGPGLVPTAGNSKSLGWSAALHRHVGNVALADGSVQQLTAAGLREQARLQGVATNWLAIP